MRLGDPIAEYGAAIARELRFDARLARRVRAEAEDHLQEWLAESGGAASEDAQREAIGAFGDPRELALAFVPLALQSLARRAAVLLALAVIGIFAAMDARVAWYGWMQWPPGEQLRAANTIAVPADRLAFATAFILALMALVYTMTRRAPARLHAAFGHEIRRCIALGAMAVVAPVRGDRHRSGPDRHSFCRIGCGCIGARSGVVADPGSKHGHVLRGLCLGKPSPSVAGATACRRGLGVPNSSPPPSSPPAPSHPVSRLHSPAPIAASRRGRRNHAWRRDRV